MEPLIKREEIFLNLLNRGLADYSKEVIQAQIEDKFKHSSFRLEGGRFTLKKCGEETLEKIAYYLIDLLVEALWADSILSPSPR